MNARVAGVGIALALGAVTTLLTLVVLALFGAQERALVVIGSSFSAPMAGLLIAGWKRPSMFLAPTWGLLVWLDARLSTPVQRVLFLASLVSAIPWVVLRVVGEALETSTIAEYARSAYYPLLNTIVEIGSWRYEPRWYDWVMVLSLGAVTLAISWHSIGRPVVNWIRGNGFQ